MTCTIVKATAPGSEAGPEEYKCETHNYIFPAGEIPSPAASCPIAMGEEHKRNTTEKEVSDSTEAARLRGVASNPPASDDTPQPPKYEGSVNKATPSPRSVMRDEQGRPINEPVKRSEDAAPTDARKGAVPKDHVKPVVVEKTSTGHLKERASPPPRATPSGGMRTTATPPKKK